MSPSNSTLLGSISRLTDGSMPSSHTQHSLAQAVPYAPRLRGGGCSLPALGFYHQPLHKPVSDSGLKSHSYGLLTGTTVTGWRKFRPQMLRTFTSELPNHLRSPLIHSKRILSSAGGRQFCDILRVCFHDQVGSANWLCVPDLKLFGSTRVTREIVAHYFFAVHSRNFERTFLRSKPTDGFSPFSLLVTPTFGAWMRMVKRDEMTRLRSQKTGEALRMSSDGAHQICWICWMIYNKIGASDIWIVWIIVWIRFASIP